MDRLLIARPLVLLFAVFALQVPITEARTVTVSPGPGTPLQDAIDAAAPYDRLVLLAGTYAEAVVVNKPLRIRGPGRYLGPLQAAIDAGCGASVAVDVAADDVVVERLEVRGGTYTQVRVQNRSNVRLRDLVPYLAQGYPGACGNEQFGIEVIKSRKVKLRDTHVRGNFTAMPCTDGVLAAAYHLLDVGPRASVKLIRAFSRANQRGVLIEGAVAEPFASSGILLQGMAISTTGGEAILLRNSDGVRIVRSVINNSCGGTPVAGIALDADSDHNVVADNDVGGNATDVIDDGTDNCWRNNRFLTGTVRGSCS